MIDEPEKVEAGNGGNGRDAAGRFAPGHRGGPGRKPGEPNHIGGDLKVDLWDAYQQRGGRAWLEKLPPRVFAGLLAKLLPRELSADVRATVQGDFRGEQRGMTDEELGRLCEEAIAAVAARHPGGDDAGAATAEQSLAETARG